VDKRTVVTGASGFIGRNLVAELNARGYDKLLLVDTLGSDDKWHNLVGLDFEDILGPAVFLNCLQTGSSPTWMPSFISAPAVRRRSATLTFSYTIIINIPGRCVIGACRTILALSMHRAPLLMAMEIKDIVMIHD